MLVLLIDSGALQERKVQLGGGYGGGRGAKAPAREGLWRGRQRLLRDSPTGPGPWGWSGWWGRRRDDLSCGGNYCSQGRWGLGPRQYGSGMRAERCWTPISAVREECGWTWGAVSLVRRWLGGGEGSLQHPLGIQASHRHWRSVNGVECLCVCVWGEVSFRRE